MERKGRRTAAEWNELWEAQRESGLTQRAWCERNGINYQTYVKRVAAVRSDVKDKAERAGTEWVEIKPEAEAVKAAGGKVTAEWVELKPVSAAATERFLVKVGMFRVEVPPVFEEAALKRICKALGELC